MPQGRWRKGRGERTRLCWPGKFVIRNLQSNLDNTGCSRSHSDNKSSQKAMKNYVKCMKSKYFSELKGGDTTGTDYIGGEQGEGAASEWRSVA